MNILTQDVVLTFILRLILGILFFFQGYDKVFRVRMPGVIEFFRVESNHRRIPDFVLRLSAYLTSYIELLGGLMLILGLFKTWALYLLGFDLILVSAAFSLLKPMWDMQLLFPRLVLLAALLYFPPGWDLISLDNMFGLIPCSEACCE
jgi:putative oxidoreductase